MQTSGPADHLLSPSFVRMMVSVHSDATDILQGRRLAFCHLLPLRTESFESETETVGQDRGKRFRKRAFGRGRAMPEPDGCRNVAPKIRAVRWRYLAGGGGCRGSASGHVADPSGQGRACGATGGNAA